MFGGFFNILLAMLICSALAVHDRAGILMGYIMVPMAGAERNERHGYLGSQVLMVNQRNGDDGTRMRPERKVALDVDKKLKHALASDLAAEKKDGKKTEQEMVEFAANQREAEQEKALAKQNAKVKNDEEAKKGGASPNSLVQQHERGRANSTDSDKRAPCFQITPEVLGINDGYKIIKVTWVCNMHDEKLCRVPGTRKTKGFYESSGTSSDMLMEGTWTPFDKCIQDTSPEKNLDGTPMNDGRRAVEISKLPRDCCVQMWKNVSPKFWEESPRFGRFGTYTVDRQYTPIEMMLISRFLGGGYWKPAAEEANANRELGEPQPEEIWNEIKTLMQTQDCDLEADMETPGNPRRFSFKSSPNLTIAAANAPFPQGEPKPEIPADTKPLKATKLKKVVNPDEHPTDDCCEPDARRKYYVNYWPGPVPDWAALLNAKES